MAATRAIESRVAIRDRVAPVQLSVQELINCVKHDPEEPDRRDCYTGSINLAFRWIIKHGILREDECPFVGHKQPCSPKPQVISPFCVCKFFGHFFLNIFYWELISFYQSLSYHDRWRSKIIARYVMETRLSCCTAWAGIRSPRLSG